MNAEPDINKIAVDLIIAATERTIQSSAGAARASLRQLLQLVSNAYKPYLEKTYQRVSTLRTFLRPNEPVSLLAAYVPAELGIDDESFQAGEVLKRYLSGQRIIISGLAGRGKSVLLKYFALSLYENPAGVVPLFVELRSLNSSNRATLLEQVHDSYKGETGVDFRDFQKALRKGYFALLLDGFDEVDPTLRSGVEAQIVALASDFEKCPLMVSGRPDDRYSSWGSFTNYCVRPMSYASIRKLIVQADYDDEVKREFLKRLTKAFFNKHKSFLSTPLLAIMLMLTFQDFAEIPSTLHVFYRNAFDTLVRRHDALKLQFLRKMHSGLSAEQFRKIFSSFCVLTYSRSQFHFSHDEIVEQLSKAILQQRIKCDVDMVLLDLVESICLIQKEGFQYSFVHRSFQEYFCALFVSQSPSGYVKKYLCSGKYRSWDEVLPMLYSMVPDRVEKEWALGAINELLSTVEGAPDPAMAFAIAVYGRLVFERMSSLGIVLHFGQYPGSHQFHALQSIYRDEFRREVEPEEDLDETPEESTAKWNKLIQGVLKEWESNGDERFAGVSVSLNPLEADDKYVTLEVPLLVTDAELARRLDFYSYFENCVKNLRLIREPVRKRVGDNDAFLEDVFQQVPEVPEKFSV